MAEQYKRYRWFDGGEVGSCKLHLDCFDAMQKAADEEDGWIEWTPGQERPSKENEDV